MGELPLGVLDCPDESLETIALIENLHRADLTPYELAKAFWKLHRTPEGEIRMSIAEVAATVTMPKDYIDSHLAIMRVPAKVRQLIIDDPKIPLRTASISAW
jgi:ParB-like chromosome segregation protein Spo0J